MSKTNRTKNRKTSARRELLDALMDGEMIAALVELAASPANDNAGPGQPELLRARPASTTANTAAQAIEPKSTSTIATRPQPGLRRQ